MLHPASSQGHRGNAREKSSATLRVLVLQPLEAGSPVLAIGGLSPQGSSQGCRRQISPK